MDFLSDVMCFAHITIMADFPVSFSCVLSTENLFLVYIIQLVAILSCLLQYHPLKFVVKNELTMAVFPKLRVMEEKC